MPAAGTPGGCGDKMTCVSIPFSSTICCTMWPGGTCIGIGTGGPLFDTIRTVAGPSCTANRNSVLITSHKYKLKGSIITHAGCIAAGMG